MANKWEYHGLVSVEHTDCTGVVYHAKYLSFLEMARMQILAKYCTERSLSVQAFYQTYGFFVVRSVTMHYAKPMRLGDGLIIESQVHALTAVRTEWQQVVRVGKQRNAEARVELIFVGKDLKPKRMPAWLAESWMEDK